MNIKIEKNKLLAPITKLVGITEKRSLMPILSNLLIDFTKEGIKIFSTDLEISAIGYIDFKTDEERKIIIHGRKFQEILREMDNGELALEIEENVLKIKQKKSEFVLGLQDPEEFPEIKEIDGKEKFSIDGKALLEMINKVGFAISVDETRYVLTGMYMRGFDKKIIVVGTDGFRMSLYQKEMEGLKGFKGIIIPKRSITEVEKVIGEKDRVTINVDDKYIQFSTSDIVLISRIIEGSFPDYENVIPEGNVNNLSVDKDSLMKGLKKVSAIIGRSEPIKITIEDKTMELEAESDIGRAKETLDVKYSGDKASMNFNVRFVMDVVAHIEGQEISIKAPTTYGAVLFEGEEGKNYRSIIMPIRI